MIWNSCFIISVIVLFIAVFYAWTRMKKYKSGRIFTPFNTIFAGVFLALFVGMIPMMSDLLKAESGSLLKLSMFDILEILQVFTLNVGPDLILDHVRSGHEYINGAYSAYMSCLFLLAPILTFGFLASFFKILLAKVFYRLHFWGDVYAFSELNEKSLVLAKNIQEKHEKALIIFANVDPDEKKILSEYVEAARELKAIIFRKDIVTIDLTRHSTKYQMNFFTIGEKEGENLIQSLKLLEKYNQRINTRLYVFSTGAEGELLLANVAKGEIIVRRINEVRATIYNFLYAEGERLFMSACSLNGRKEIKAVVIGLGKYGTEMLKALTWYSQMDGYSIDIHVFDKDELAEEKFMALCPELMSEKYNGAATSNQGNYSIQIHSNIDVRTKTFADYMATLPKTTFVFVCLGDDEVNINQAANIRMLCARAGCEPIIKTVIYSVDEKEALSGTRNYSGQAYGIEAIGDLNSTYSEDILIGSKLEKLALERHLKWGKEEEFYKYEYNYRSSMASAIHMKARISCGIPGADKRENELTLEERNIIENLEHRRWNVYMRSEGYVYSGSPERSTKNDLAKMHCNLVDIDLLNEEEKRKDSSVGTR